MKGLDPAFTLFAIAEQLITDAKTSTQKAVARIVELERQRDYLREVLRPFAEYADAGGDSIESVANLQCHSDWAGVTRTMTGRDFRSASAAMRETEEK